MFDLMKPRITAMSSGVVGLSVVAASLVALTTVGSADASQQQAAPASTSQLRAASTSPNQVTSHSWIRGTTANGRMVTGQFRPRTFTESGNQLLAKGRLRLVIHRLSDNSVKRVIVKRGATLPVAKVNGTPIGQNKAAARNLAGTSAAAAACPVLKLVLGPLHLDLLGLVIDLNKVVLNITAVPGPGKLLGNLLCAVAGLLDGTPLSGLLSQLAVLLNSILAILNA